MINQNNMKEITREEVLQNFERQVNHLGNAEVNKIIPQMNSKSLKALCKDKKRSGAYLVISKDSNFVLMFFYHVNNGMGALQYVIGKDIMPDGVLALSGLFAEYALKCLDKLKVAYNHNILELAEYFSKQIRHYKEFQKGQQH